MKYEQYLLPEIQGRRNLNLHIFRDIKALFGIHVIMNAIEIPMIF